MKKTVRSLCALLSTVLLLTGCSAVTDQLHGAEAGAQSEVVQVQAARSYSSAGIKRVHTPKILVKDLNLAPGQCHVRQLGAAAGTFLPDPKCTPGATDPAVTQANIQATICHKGYTKTVRPGANLTGPAKHTSLRDYGMAYSRTTEYDHLVPLELGGASSVSNLWPEPNRSSAASVNNPKDSVENALNSAVCRHKVTLAAAQTAIAANWTTALKTLRLR